MNKLAADNFDSITGKLLNVLIAGVEVLPNPAQFLTLVVEVIFEKAVKEPRYADNYCKLCVCLSENLPHEKGGQFKKFLLNKCQKEFETKTVIPLPDPNSISDPEELVALEEARNRLNDRNNGVPQFIGALFLHGLISEKIIHYCLRSLLTTDEADLLKFAALLTLIGKTLDHPKARVLMDAYFAKIQAITQNKTLPTRIRFRLVDVQDLRKNNWQPKRVVPLVPSVKTEAYKQLNLQEGR
jgi:translation initiation factor 4G